MVVKHHSLHEAPGVRTLTSAHLPYLGATEALQNFCWQLQRVPRGGTRKHPHLPTICAQWCVDQRWLLDGNDSSQRIYGVNWANVEFLSALCGVAGEEGELAQHCLRVGLSGLCLYYWIRNVLFSDSDQISLKLCLTLWTRLGCLPLTIQWSHCQWEGFTFLSGRTRLMWSSDLGDKFQGIINKA